MNFRHQHAAIKQCLHAWSGQALSEPIRFHMSLPHSVGGNLKNYISACRGKRLTAIAIHLPLESLRSLNGHGTAARHLSANVRSQGALLATGIFEEH